MVADSVGAGGFVCGVGSSGSGARGGGGGGGGDAGGGGGVGDGWAEGVTRETGVAPGARGLSGRSPPLA